MKRALTNQLTNLHSRNEFPSFDSIVKTLAEAREFFLSLSKSLPRPDNSSAGRRILRSFLGISLVSQVKRLHGHSLKCGFLSDIRVSSCFILTYSRFLEGRNASQLSAEMPERSGRYFDAAISDFASSGCFTDVLDVFEEMLEFRFRPSYDSVCNAITACTELTILDKGKRVHDVVYRVGFDRNVSICNLLISMYIQMGRLDLAQSTLDGMERKDLILWNSLITGYVETGDWAAALDVFISMRIEGPVAHNNATLVDVALACAQGGKLDLGKSLHAHCICTGLYSDFHLGTAILDMYAKCGKIEYAELFLKDEEYENSLVSWNSLILGYVKSCYYDVALYCFQRLCRDSYFNPDSITFANAIPAYSCLRSFDGVKSIHALTMKKGMIEDIALRTALIDAYGKLSNVVGAEYLCVDFIVADTPMWNAMFTTYYLNNCPDKGISLFAHVVQSQIPIDSNTVVLLLQLSGQLGSLKIGKMAHGYSFLKGFSAHLEVENSLLDMYMRCNSVENSERLFQFMNVKDIVSWNTMLSGYVKIDSLLKALKLFSQMLLDRSHKPDSSTLVSLIHASAFLLNSHGPDVGHSFVTKLGFCAETAVMNSLMDAYMKTGFIDKAKSLILHMGHSRDQRSWNLMITGCGMNGLEEKACELLTHMFQDGYEPDSGTFSGLLSACAHSGMINKGCYYFDLMVNNYNIYPDLEHCTSIISMFGQAGRLEAAYKLSKLCDTSSGVTPSDSRAIWGAFMDACRMYKKGISALTEGQIISEDEDRFLKFLNWLVKRCQHKIRRV